MKRLFILSFILLFVLALVGCNKTKNGGNKTQNKTTADVNNSKTKEGSQNVSKTNEAERTNLEIDEEKWIDGVEPVFNEALGFSTESPSAIQIGATRYLYYTDNVSKYSEKTQIVVRKGTYRNGTFVYGNPKVCITPTEGSWDSGHVFEADVVKGKFNYNDHEYSYLMAYSGNSRTKDRKNASIGIALSDAPDGEWIKVGTTPFVKFDSSEYDSTGLLMCGGNMEPSLISFDQEGKVYLFYEKVENFQSNFVMEVDFSNINDIDIYSHRILETSGMSDLGISNPHLYGCDYCLDSESNELISIREKAVTQTNEPKYSDQLEVLKAPQSIITYSKQEWTGIEDYIDTLWTQFGEIIDGDSTAVFSENKLGYSRLYSPTIVTDQYGRLIEYGKLSILYTTIGAFGDSRSKYDSDYLFTAMIHEYNMVY